MVEQVSAKDFSELFGIIAAPGADPAERGSVLVTVKLWDGRTVLGSGLPSDLQPVDIESDQPAITDSKALKPLVRALVDQGKPFVAEMGSDDMVCRIRWTIDSGCGL